MVLTLTEHGKLELANPGFDSTVRVLYVADLDEKAASDATMPIVGSEAGLPGGTYLGHTDEIYQKFNMAVAADVPLRLQGASNEPRLRVNYRAQSSDNFTAVGIKNQRAKPGEMNDVQQAYALVTRVIQELSSDLSEEVPARQRKEERPKLASALRALAAAIEPPKAATTIPGGEQ